MFRKSLKDKIERIFDLNKVTFDQVSESMEQECAFIEVEECRARIKDGLEVAKVTGTIKIYVQQEKMPYGYLQKRIHAADPADTKDLFFFNIEINNNVFQNLVERSIGFNYFFNSQHDPNLGTITSIDISEA